MLFSHRLGQFKSVYVFYPLKIGRQNIICVDILTEYVHKYVYNFTHIIHMYIHTIYKYIYIHVWLYTHSFRNKKYLCILVGTKKPVRPHLLSLKIIYTNALTYTNLYVFMYITIYFRYT